MESGQGFDGDRTLFPKPKHQRGERIHETEQKQMLKRLGRKGERQRCCPVGDVIGSHCEEVAKLERGKPKRRHRVWGCKSFDGWPRDTFCLG